MNDKMKLDEFMLKQEKKGTILLTCVKEAFVADLLCFIKEVNDERLRRNV